MRLTSIELENFRCFEKEKVNLHPQLNVFVGLNASGKTALLEGIGLGIGQFFGPLMGRSFKIEKSDVRQSSLTESKDQTRSASISFNGVLPSQSLDSQWRLAYGTAEDHSKIKEFQSTVNTIHLRLRDQLNDTNLPVLLYFSTHRHWGSDGRQGRAKESILKGLINVRLAGYLEALNKRIDTFFFEKEFDQEQRTVQQSKELGYPYDDSRLSLIQTIAGKVIEDCKIFYFDYEKESLALMFNDGRRLTVNELSDGQKSLLLISTGIAFQCATLNPHMGLDAYNSNGVVLIDEVELHLHPDWQRQILPILTREFPNIQFICTTHSPQVISTLKPENVQVIKDFKIRPLKIHTEGRDSNNILKEVFGIEKRPKEFGDKLQHFYSLLEKHAIDEAKTVFDDLEAHWGTMDTEIVRARYFLEDLEDDLARAKEVAK